MEEGICKLYPIQKTRYKPIMLFNKHERCTDRVVREPIFSYFDHHQLIHQILPLLKLIWLIKFLLKQFSNPDI